MKDERPKLTDLTGLGFGIRWSGTSYLIDCNFCGQSWGLAKSGVQKGRITHPGNFLFFVNHSYEHKTVTEK